MYFLGIDIGTSGTKALLIDAAGVVASSATVEYPLSTPRPLWSEQDPNWWWDATIASIRRVLAQGPVDASSVAAIGLTGQMHGLVLLDVDGSVLRPAILWNDQRTGRQCEWIHERIGVSDLIEETGKPALAGFTASKVRWVIEHEQQIAAATGHLLLPKDYVRYRLSGEFCTDVADASGTQLFSVGERSWSSRVIQSLEIPERWLPSVAESPVVTAAVHRSAAEATGLRPGTPIVAGAGDQAAEAVGCGVVEPGTVAVTVGTSGVVFAVTDGYRFDPTGGLHAYCHASTNRWHVMGVMLSAGGSLRWYRDLMFGDRESDGAGNYPQLIDEAMGVAAGSEGLLFLPYLTGERTPHPDPHARGGFIGLTVRHRRPHLTRAVLEGVAFGLRDCLELLAAIGVKTQRLRISGGGARSAPWRQIMADVLARPLSTVNVTQGAAFGAAMLAAVGGGAHPTVAAAAQAMVQETGTTEPGPEVAAYAEMYPRYRALYPALASEFDALSRL